MNIKIMNRKEIRLRTENADEYISVYNHHIIFFLNHVDQCM